MDTNIKSLGLLGRVQPAKEDDISQELGCMVRLGLNENRDDKVISVGNSVGESENVKNTSDHKYEFYGEQTSPENQLNNTTMVDLSDGVTSEISSSELLKGELQSARLREEEPSKSVREMVKGYEQMQNERKTRQADDAKRNKVAKPKLRTEVEQIPVRDNITPNKQLADSTSREGGDKIDLKGENQNISQNSNATVSSALKANAVEMDHAGEGDEDEKLLQYDDASDINQTWGMTAAKSIENPAKRKSPCATPALLNNASRVNSDSCHVPKRHLDEGGAYARRKNGLEKYLVEMDNAGENETLLQTEDTSKSLQMQDKPNLYRAPSTSQINAGCEDDDTSNSLVPELDEEPEVVVDSPRSSRNTESSSGITNQRNRITRLTSVICLWIQKNWKWSLVALVIVILVIVIMNLSIQLGQKDKSPPTIQPSLPAKNYICVELRHLNDTRKTDSIHLSVDPPVPEVCWKGNGYVKFEFADGTLLRCSHPQEKPRIKEFCSTCCLQEDVLAASVNGVHCIKPPSADFFANGTEMRAVKSLNVREEVIVLLKGYPYGTSVHVSAGERYLLKSRNKCE